MDPPQMFPPGTPGTPLFPVSPERMNGSKALFGLDTMKPLPQSPSMPMFATSSSPSHEPRTPTHSRHNSEVHVQGMIARFNHLDVRDFKEAHRRDEVALKRAEMAREMAELESKKLKEEKEQLQETMKQHREEARQLKKQVQGHRDDLLRLSKRNEALMEDLVRSKKESERMSAKYNKECNNRAKESFNASSRVVKLQEELKFTRTSLHATQTRLESERNMVARREAETLAAQCQLVSLQEELQKARDQIMTTEQEKDALKLNLKEEEVARIAAEGRIALPASLDDDEDLASPKKSPKKQRTFDVEDKENITPFRSATELESVQEELLSERQRRERAEDQVEFMKMECQFGCCSCRVAELNKTRYVHDSSYAADVEMIKTLAAPAASQADARDTVLDAVAGQDDMEVDLHLIPVPALEPSEAAEDEDTPPSRHEENLGSVALSEPRDVRLFRNQLSRITEATVECSPQVSRDKENQDPTFIEEHFVQSTPTKLRDDMEEEGIAVPSEPQTPLNPIIRTITTTTTIPLQFSPLKPAELPPTPSTVSHAPLGELRNLPIDREAALEQIRLRRGRARSIAASQLTPRKQMFEGTGAGGRRDISAPAMRTWNGICRS